MNLVPSLVFKDELLLRYAYFWLAHSFLTNDTMDVPVPTVNVLTIEDGNALFYYLKEIADNLK